MEQKFTQTAIVIVEVTEPKKAQEIRYITIGCIGSRCSEFELGQDALDYVETAGTKEVKSVIMADSEQYKQFLDNNLKDFVQK